MGSDEELTSEAEISRTILDGTHVVIKYTVGNVEHLIGADIPADVEHSTIRSRFMALIKDLNT